MKVLIFGGTGLLGSDLHKSMGAQHQVHALASADADISNPEVVREKIKFEKPDVVINSAALTDVDKCENEPDRAYLVNAMGPKNIAMACRDQRVKMVHISTDYVFDGKKGEPYNEFDQVNPINIYGRSKLAGEQYVKEITNDHVIVRTAWIFGEKRNHFVDYVVNGIKNGEEIVTVKDMVSSPTYSIDLAEGVKTLVELNQTGTFHLANKGYCSRVQLAEEIMKVLRKPGKFQVVNQSQWKRPAVRPAFSALRNYHMSLINADNMPGWRDALKRYIKYKFE